MLEVRGIVDYQQYSTLSGKSRRGEGDGADFRQLMHAGGDGDDPRLIPENRNVAEDGPVSGSGRETITYDLSGRASSFGIQVGRKINVAI